MYSIPVQDELRHVRLTAQLIRRVRLTTHLYRKEGSCHSNFGVAQNFDAKRAKPTNFYYVFDNLLSLKVHLHLILYSRPVPDLIIYRVGSELDQAKKIRYFFTAVHGSTRPSGWIFGSSLTQHMVGQIGSNLGWVL